MTGTSTKTTQRITWNETTFDADVLHLTMIDEINRLIHVADTRTKALRASKARERQLRQALEAMVTTEEEDPCWYDHHGNCQAHGLQPKGECYMELARAALAEETNDG